MFLLRFCGIAGVALASTGCYLPAPTMSAFDRPFGVASFPLQFFDHDRPLVNADTNAQVLTHWFEYVNSRPPGTGGHMNGHAGYDYGMPVGTPVFAVADGFVTAAQLTPPETPCGLPDLPAFTSNSIVEIEHDLQAHGIVVRTRYVHLDSIAVMVGQSVKQGDPIGESGERGCVMSPHLHFETQLRVVNDLGAVEFRPIDPYGSRKRDDPWSQNGGARSINLWNEGEAPQLFREQVLTVSPGAARVYIARVRWMGVRDDRDPNEEFVELRLNTGLTSEINLGGFRIRGDRSNVDYALPASVTLTAAQPWIRIYSGTGTDTATALYMDRSAPVWSNHFDDCARRSNTNEPALPDFVLPLGGDCD